MSNPNPVTTLISESSLAVAETIAVAETVEEVNARIEKLLEGNWDPKIWAGKFDSIKSYILNNLINNENIDEPLKEAIEDLRKYIKECGAEIMSFETTLAKMQSEDDKSLKEELILIPAKIKVLQQNLVYLKEKLIELEKFQNFDVKDKDVKDKKERNIALFKYVTSRKDFWETDPYEYRFCDRDKAEETLLSTLLENKQYYLIKPAIELGANPYYRFRKLEREGFEPSDDTVFAKAFDTSSVKGLEVLFNAVPLMDMGMAITRGILAKFNCDIRYLDEFTLKQNISAQFLITYFTKKLIQAVQFLQSNAIKVDWDFEIKPFLSRNGIYNKTEGKKTLETIKAFVVVFDRLKQLAKTLPKNAEDIEVTADIKTTQDIKTTKEEINVQLPELPRQVIDKLEEGQKLNCKNCNVVINCDVPDNVEIQVLDGTLTINGNIIGKNVKIVAENSPEYSTIRVASWMPATNRPNTIQSVWNNSAAERLQQIQNAIRRDKYSNVVITGALKHSDSVEIRAHGEVLVSGKEMLVQRPADEALDVFKIGVMESHELVAKKDTYANTFQMKKTLQREVQEPDFNHIYTSGQYSYLMQAVENGHREYFKVFKEVVPPLVHHRAMLGRYSEGIMTAHLIALKNGDMESFQALLNIEHIMNIGYILDQDVFANYNFDAWLKVGGCEVEFIEIVVSKLKEALDFVASKGVSKEHLDKHTLEVLEKLNKKGISIENIKAGIPLSLQAIAYIHSEETFDNNHGSISMVKSLFGSIIQVFKDLNKKLDQIECRTALAKYKASKATASATATPAASNVASAERPLVQRTGGFTKLVDGVDSNKNGVEAYEIDDLRAIDAEAAFIINIDTISGNRKKVKVGFEDDSPLEDDAPDNNDSDDENAKFTDLQSDTKISFENVSEYVTEVIRGDIPNGTCIGSHGGDIIVETPNIGDNVVFNARATESEKPSGGNITFLHNIPPTTLVHATGKVIVNGREMIVSNKKPDIALAKELLTAQNKYPNVRLLKDSLKGMKSTDLDKLSLNSVDDGWFNREAAHLDPILFVAARQGEPAYIEALVSMSGGHYGFLLNRFSLDNRTALTEALQYKNFAAVNWFLRYGIETVPNYTIIVDGSYYHSYSYSYLPPEYYATDTNSRVEYYTEMAKVLFEVAEISCVCFDNFSEMEEKFIQFLADKNIKTEQNLVEYLASKNTTLEEEFFRFFVLKNIIIKPAKKKKTEVMKKDNAKVSVADSEAVYAELKKDFEENFAQVRIENAEDSEDDLGEEFREDEAPIEKNPLFKTAAYELWKKDPAFWEAEIFKHLQTNNNAQALRNGIFNHLFKGSRHVRFSLISWDELNTKPLTDSLVPIFKRVSMMVWIRRQTLGMFKPSSNADSNPPSLSYENQITNAYRNSVTNVSSASSTATQTVDIKTLKDTKECSEFANLLPSTIVDTTSVSDPRDLCSFLGSRVSISNELHRRT